MTPTRLTIEGSSGSRFSRIVNILYGSAVDIAFFIIILSVVAFVSGLVVPKTIDTGSQTCIQSLAAEGSDGAVCHATQRHRGQALQRLLETISAEVH
ncbi:hypothetical protein I6F35_29485 [Bradyrhizobium sp. BRP22]|uniref:hypothetical protein n=1 Tax=Bradyrhizobium sp. BRP22 TaxID=2793821 RepID=UPI001CD1FA81|nr:hypothetical protein [Bradyrhizobium sp. BRP22]MCA1457293.1 hypothetical protein [Bradyrhizobium sp. BRP22]